MDAELQKWVDSELAKCYRRYQDTETWPKCYYLPDPPQNFDRPMTRMILSLDVSYRWRKEEILVQSIEYSGSVLRHRANTEYGSQYAVYNADFYCLNYIDQLRRIKPYDMAGCITVLQWIKMVHETYLGSVEHQEMAARAQVAIDRIKKREETLRATALCPMEKCKMLCASKVGLKVHMEYHTHETSFHCERCGMYFPGEVSLRQHLAGYRHDTAE